MADDGGLTLVHFVTFVAGAAIALLLAIAAQAVASRRVRAKDNVQQLAANLEKDGTAVDAWCDPEKGQCGKGASSGEKDGGPDVPLPLTRQELFETLRGLLGDEISKGLARSEVIERLDRLEKGAEIVGEGLRSAALASADDAEAKNALKVTLKSSQKSVETRSPNSSDRSGGSSLPEEDSKELPGMIAAAALVTPTPPPSPPQEAPLPPSMPPPRADESRSALEFGPTSRQRRRQEPPEKISHIDEETSLQGSLAVVQKVLGRRDAQTTELHKQLREARQHLWFHTEEARVARARLHEILTNPSRAPQAQAEALDRLQQEVKELSSCLADSRADEQHWATIAKRQKAFFMQNERLSREPGDLLKKHPAGDIFLAPPPVVLHDDELPSQQPTWDIATSHCNPYCVDSWPFEPNVLAQRASQEPNLHRWEEGEDEYMDDDDEEEDVVDDDQDSQEDDNGGAEMRWVPPAGGDSNIYSPPGGSDTARSL